MLFGVSGGGLGSLFAAAILVGARGETSNVNIALVLVLIVMVAAIVGGRTAGAMSGLVAATSFDFFHTRPYGSLKIARADDLVTTLLLLVVGLVVGAVAERSGWFKARLREEKRHLRRLYRVGKLATSGGEDDRDLVLIVTAELMEALRLRDCSFERPPFLSELPHLEPDGAMSGSPLSYGPEEVALPGGGVDLRVIGRGDTIGRFVLVPRPDERVSAERLLVSVALAQELGLALAATGS